MRKSITTNRMDSLIARMDAIRPDTKTKKAEVVAKEEQDQATAQRRMDLGLRAWMQDHRHTKAGWPPLSPEEREELEKLEAQFVPDPLDPLADHWTVPRRDDYA
jgi:hypothetical protein